MKKYKHDRACPKCGQNDIVGIFVKKGDRYYKHSENYKTEAEEDLIKRHCRNCHYEWGEKPLNK